jgi:hypothetical protein
MLKSMYQNTCEQLHSQTLRKKIIFTHLFQIAGCLLQTSSTSSDYLYLVKGPETNNKINCRKLILLSEIYLDHLPPRTITRVTP